MVKITEQRSDDWVSSTHTNIIIWWLPKGAIIAALFAAVPLRAAVWTVALLWMGTACILNARRCGRTHCRYTGAVLLGDDTFSACPGLRLNLREHLRLARTCPSYRLRCLGDLVDDRTPMGQVLERLMSAIGTKRTFVCAAVMSAFGGKGTS